MSFGLFTGVRYSRQRSQEVRCKSCF